MKYKSHPLWVRGLKQNLPGDIVKKLSVAPFVGAWIETILLTQELLWLWSHPLWVRGLKRIWWYLHSKPFRVAPFVGAWIETLESVSELVKVSSRTLCGCVD